MGPPKGLSFLARSTSTWIHWWSPVESANLLTMSWVISTQSLVPSVSPWASSHSCALVKVRTSASSVLVLPQLRGGRARGVRRYRSQYACVVGSGGAPAARHRSPAADLRHGRRRDTSPRTRADGDDVPL